MKVKTNLLFEQDREFSIGPKPLLVGSNGSGKTMLLNAIRLALIGSAQDLGGRDQFAAVKAGSSLINLGDVHRSPYAEVTFKSGQVARWGVVAGKRPTHVMPPVGVAYLMDEVMEAIRGSADTRLTFFCRRFLGLYDEVATWQRQKKRLASLKKKLKVVEGEMELLRRHGVESIGMQTQLGEIQAEVKELTAGVAELRANLWKLLKGQTYAISLAIVTHLGEDSPIAFGFDVAEKEIRMGRLLNDTIHPYASGAQWILLATAICAAVTHVKDLDKPLYMVIIPDRALDEDMILNIMRVASRIDGAVIFPCLPFTNYSPSLRYLTHRYDLPAWTVLDLDDEAQDA